MRKRLKKKLAKKNRYAHWGKPISFPLCYPEALMKPNIFHVKEVSLSELARKYPKQPEISMELIMGLCRMGREK